MDETKTDEVPQKQVKWTKEYMREYQREYMRNRWRRVHGVKPENFREVRNINKLEEASKYGEQAVQYLKDMKQKEREKRKKEPTPKVECQVCRGLYVDTEGHRKMHERTKRHKIGLEIQDAKMKK